MWGLAPQHKHGVQSALAALQHALVCHGHVGASSSSISLQWQEPEQDNGSPVTSYLLESASSSGRGGPAWHKAYSGQQTQCTVSLSVKCCNVGSSNSSTISASRHRYQILKEGTSVVLQAAQVLHSLAWRQPHYVAEYWSVRAACCWTRCLLCCCCRMQQGFLPACMLQQRLVTCCMPAAQLQPLQAQAQ